MDEVEANVAGMRQSCVNRTLRAQVPRCIFNNCSAAYDLPVVPLIVKVAGLPITGGSGVKTTLEGTNCVRPPSQGSQFIGCCAKHGAAR